MAREARLPVGPRSVQGGRLSDGGVTNYVKVFGRSTLDGRLLQLFACFSDSDPESVSFAVSDASMLVLHLHAAGVRSPRMALYRPHPSFRCARIVGEG